MLVIVAQMVKRVPGMRETRVRSLGWEDPLEKEMATHSSIHAWRIPWTEEPGRLQSMGSQSQTRLSDFTFTLYIRMIFGVLWVTENILLYFIHLLFEIDENQLSAEFMWEPSHVNHAWLDVIVPLLSPTPLTQCHSQELPSFLAHLVLFPPLCHSP